MRFFHLSAAILTLLLADCVSGDELGCTVTFRLTDSETRAVIPGLIRVTEPSGYRYGLDRQQDRCVGFPKDTADLRWHVLTSETKIRLPAMNGLQVEAFSGLETNLASVTLDLDGKSKADLTIPLKRIFSAKKAGYVSGNTHLHLRDLTRKESDRYLREIPPADGLSVVFVSHLERAIVDRTYITNSYTGTDLHEELSSPSLAFGHGEEYRHNFSEGGEGYGHVMLLDLHELIHPASIGPGITKDGTDSPPLRNGIEAAREQDATIIWCHNGFGLEDLPSFVSGLVHAQNIFDGGNRGTYADTCYRYLNTGMRVPFSTGTDWFLYDFSRAYVEMPTGEPVLADRWLKGLRAGRSFITNGPFLELTVNGSRPGDTIELKEDTSLEIEATALSRLDFGRAQLIHNGKVIEEDISHFADFTGSHYAAEISATLKTEEPGWLALRIEPSPEITNEMGKVLFAHTSPVYLSRDGHLRFETEVARGMVDEMTESLSAIHSTGTFATDTERQVVETIYEKAISTLRERIDAAEP